MNSITYATFEIYETEEEAIEALADKERLVDAGINPGGATKLRHLFFTADNGVVCVSFRSKNPAAKGFLLMSSSLERWTRVISAQR